MIHSAAGDVFYNCELTQRPDGFMMVTEQSQAGIRFYYTTNLYNWGIYGGCMNSPPAFACACPTIDYGMDGMHYFTALRTHTDGTFQTWICKSQAMGDVSAFTWGNKALLVPEGPFEGTNASDFSFCEWHGMTLCTYFVGSQDPNQSAFARRGIYPGSKDQLWAEFF